MQSKVEFTHDHAVVNGLDWHFVQIGPHHSPPVILLPGWPETWYAWRRLMPLLADRGKHVIAFDLPGMGETDFLPEGTTYDASRIADLLYQALRSLGFAQVDLVAHDLGCWVAYSLATSFPQMVRRLGLLEAAVPGISPPFDLSKAPKVFQFYFNAVPELPEMLTRGKERELLSWLFRTKSADANAIGPEDLDEYMRSYSDPRRMAAGFAYYRAVPMNIQKHQTAPALAMPTLALGGEKGVGMALYQSLRDRAESLTGGMLEGCGHYLPEECPRELADHVLSLLAAD